MNNMDIDAVTGRGAAYDASGNAKAAVKLTPAAEAERLKAKHRGKGDRREENRHRPGPAGGPPNPAQEQRSITLKPEKGHEKGQGEMVRRGRNRGFGQKAA